ncbi:magnesium-dependent phosphatase-1 [Fistulina hepatica ATCC 64428]|uniref:Magnesium-dependent phosphatase-1 n=1 Tax=Fistulina hepatica ATCC 64428 TaxID=1128425 RepID=A0A0D7AFM2_9AGAR|nr:magnesium-dependent phosphatase-1 [Fistulina hepatica ATCC 64428]
MSQNTKLPKLVAFDLDYTLWPLWIDTHTGPLHSDKDHPQRVLDKYDAPVEFYKHVSYILYHLRDAGVIIAAASRTCAPRLARQALTLITIKPDPGTSSKTSRAIDLFDRLEIYPGSKMTHFRRLHEKTGIPYSEMLFFDDEHRNIEVERLGVTFCLVRNGLDKRTYESGLAEWRRRHPVQKQPYDAI